MTWTYIAPDHVATCNLCGSPPCHWLTIAERDRAGYHARSVACRNCGLVFLTPRMTAQGYAEFYDCGAYRDTPRLVSGKETSFEEILAGQGRYVASLVPWLDGKLTGGERMLDIGGSTGVVANEIKKRYGYGRCTVLDPSLKEIRHARSLGLHAKCGTLEEVGGPEWMQYNLILLLQTVEHLMDIAGGLAKIRGLLAPGGLFLVDIVCIENLYAKFIERTGSLIGACKIDHPFSLRDSTMRSYLMRSGFEIIDRAWTDGPRKKVIFLCRAGQAVAALPKRDDVEKFFGLIQEMANARVGT